MTPDQVRASAKLLLDREALIAARALVQKKVWRERDEPEPIGSFCWDGVRLSGVELSRAELDEWLRQKMEVVNSLLSELGVVLRS
jgi:hypothetical protein